MSSSIIVTQLQQTQRLFDVAYSNFLIVNKLDVSGACALAPEVLGRLLPSSSVLWRPWALVDILGITDPPSPYEPACQLLKTGEAPLLVPLSGILREHKCGIRTVWHDDIGLMGASRRQVASEAVHLP